MPSNSETTTSNPTTAVSSNPLEEIEDSWENLQLPPESPAVNQETGEFIPDKYTVLLYHFDPNEQYTAVDISKGFNHGYAFQVTLEADANENSYAKFNRGSYIKVNHSSSLVFKNEYTVEFWFKPDKSTMLSSYPKLIIKPTSLKGSGKPIFTLFFDTTHHLKRSPLIFAVSDKQGEFVRVNTQIMLSELIDKWTYIAACYENKKLLLYINGNLVGTNKLNNGLCSGDKSIYFAQMEHESNRFFTGMIDEVRISTICRSPHSIQKTYEIQWEKLFDLH